MTPQIAVLTITRNESHFLPKWLNYYSSVGHLYVLDHESSDGSTGDGRGYCRIRVSNHHTDDVLWMRNLVHCQIDRLLVDYPVVVFSEVDELLIPDPDRYWSLKSFILSQIEDRNRITATGYDVFPDNQWSRSDAYDKTLIVSRNGGPIRWGPGFHRPDGDRPDPHPDLYLVHYHYQDREVAWQRLQARMNGGRTPFPDGHGFQNKFTDRVPFDAHFTSVVSRPHEPIPAQFRSFL